MKGGELLLLLGVLQAYESVPAKNVQMTSYFG